MLINKLSRAHFIVCKWRYCGLDRSKHTNVIRVLPPLPPIFLLTIAPRWTSRSDTLTATSQHSVFWYLEVTKTKSLVLFVPMNVKALQARWSTVNPGSLNFCSRKMLLACSDMYLLMYLLMYKVPCSQAGARFNFCKLYQGRSWC